MEVSESGVSAEVKVYSAAVEEVCSTAVSYSGESDSEVDDSDGSSVGSGYKAVDDDAAAVSWYAVAGYKAEDV